MEGLRLRMDDFSTDNQEPESFPFPAGGVFGPDTHSAASTGDFVLRLIDRMHGQLSNLNDDINDAFAIHPSNDDTWPPYAA